MREHETSIISAPYADTSANRRGWGEVGDGYWCELQHDPRHWGGQLRRFIPVSGVKTTMDALEDARDKAA